MVLIAMAFVAQGVHIAERNSLANDEAKHLSTGWLLLQTGDCCLGVDNSPLTAWFALPLIWLDVPSPDTISGISDAHAAGRALIFGARDPDAIILSGRVMGIAAGVLLLLAVRRLGDRLLGSGAGVAGAAVLTFEPNVLAHFSLVSTDALFTLTAVVFVLTLDHALTKPSRRSAALVGAAFGLAVIAKLSGFALAPAAVALLALYRAQLRRHPMGRWIANGAIALGVSSTVVWLGYGAHASIHPPFLTIPGLIDGLAQVRGLSSTGFMSYYLGETGRHWPTYFLGCLLFKTPVAELALWLVALVVTFALARRRGLGRHLVPAVMAAFFLAVGLASNLNIGVRHVLPVYVFAAIAAGALVGWRPRWAPRGGGPGLLTLIVVAVAVESLRVSPHALSYFNSIAGGPVGGFRYLGDSNLDWGQDLKALRDVMKRERIEEVILAYLGTTDPEHYGIRYQYLPHMFFGSTHGNRVVDPDREILAVSTSNLQGIVSARADFTWLRERKPFAMAGYSIYLYDITGDALAHAHLATIYDRYHLAELAAKERAKVTAQRAVESGPSPAAGDARAPTDLRRVPR